ncbi:hypothetical protein AALO_G00288340 [Alosa alosa]|uniref:C-type lectin domain-containing protein n=1 Tax=Alosa alosa TaxID=278164 RepID=A0AAV6FG55_9TELE|nr:hypothetical protein AALO_G00288340 [Alosa alosa]
MGADLVTIDSEEEQAYISGLGRWGWIGLQRRGTSWTWVNGRPLSISRGPVIWGSGQPSKTEDCVMTSSHWEDYPCYSKFYPICEKSAK